jgi:HEAT repeat protein
MSHDEVVACMGVPHLSRAALWWLVAIGTDATPAVRAGLQSDNAAVRRGCCEFLEHWRDPESFAEMEPLLEDPDSGVRMMAGHALTCDHCRDGTWATKALRRAST